MKNYRRKQPDLAFGGTSDKDVTSLIKVDWQFDARIAVLTATVLSRQAIDQWFDVISEIIKDWPSDKPYLLLHDSSDPRNILTPYVRARVRELYPFRPDLKGKIAVIVPRTIGGQMFRIYMNNIARSHNITMRAFVTREDGLDWLVKSLQV